MYAKVLRTTMATPITPPRPMTAHCDCWSPYDLFVNTSIPGHSLHHLLHRTVVVTYVNVDIHSICLIMILYCFKSRLLSVLYTNLTPTTNY